MTRKQIINLANELEARLVQEMPQDVYEAYKALPRETRVAMTFDAMQKAAVALK